MYRSIQNYHHNSKISSTTIYTPLNTRSVPGGIHLPSHAKGWAILKILNETEFHIELFAFFIQDITMAHIHFINEKDPNTNGPILLWLENSMKDPLEKTNGVLVSKKFSINDFLIPTTMSKFIKAIKEQRLYYNIHTVKFPNGELAGII